MDSAKRPLSGWFWGRMDGLGMQVRIVSLAFAVVAIGALSFTQLGFWPVGVIDAKPVYLMLILGPLVMGALMFGPMTGALLGLIAGAVLHVHAMFIPLDFYEIYFMTPLNTFGLLTVLGGLAGWLFSIVVRNSPQGAARRGLIALTCVGLSCAASLLMAVNTIVMYGGLESIEMLREYLLLSPLGGVVQALLDAVLMVVLSWLADAAIERVRSNVGDRTLLSLFRNWMLIVSGIVFMCSSAVIFSVVTLQAQENAVEDMESEIEYLTRQIGGDANLDREALLDGYEVGLDGWVVVTDSEGVIVASDDPDGYPVGASFLSAIGYGDIPEDDSGAFLQGAADEEAVTLIQAAADGGPQSMDVIFLEAGFFDGGYIAVLRSPEMIYRERFGVMTASTLLALLLIASIAAVATALLNRVVVRRIDETNDSLSKITGGDLGERVKVRDSREFSSLSRGINTTVSALKDSIAEAEQRNAQDLATAKAIQESALPREFPPFPEIDKFDIYASMKTAKEVGGDFYDFFLIDDNRLGFVMADVSGKGIPAALFMMTAKTQIRNYMEAGLPLGEAVDAANHQLCIGNDAGMFVTTYACVLDYETGVLSYVNAGHNPPLLLHGGTWEWIRDVSGMPLGLFDGIPYEQLERQLEPGDMLYLYTDGVTEAMGSDGVLFGEGRLEETLAKYADMNPRSLGVGVRRAITEFTLDCEQSDDITMLALKYGVPPERKAVMILNATDDQLIHVFNFIHEELKRRNAPKSVYNPLDIAAEELFVNVCHYAYPDATPEHPGEVRIGFMYEANPPSLTVRITDSGIPYDPLAKPDAVTPDDISDVPIGGLGILMAKNSVDEMSYERVDGRNVVTFVKKW